MDEEQGHDDSQHQRQRRKQFRRQADQRMYDMAHNASQDALAAIGKIEQHEAVCAERWSQIRGSVDLILKLIGWGGAAMAGAGGLVIWYFTTSFMEAVRASLQAMGKPAP